MAEESWQSFSLLVALISAFIHNFDIYIDGTYECPLVLSDHNVEELCQLKIDAFSS